jgi:hypothetical protein
LLRNSNCGCPLRIGKLAELLLLLLVLLSRDLIACIALFVLEEQLPRKLLVQLGLRGLSVEWRCVRSRSFSLVISSF